MKQEFLSFTASILPRNFIVEELINKSKKFLEDQKEESWNDLATTGVLLVMKSTMDEKKSSMDNYKEVLANIKDIQSKCEAK